MNAKKFFVGGLILSAMFINFSPAFADEEVEIFGSEFEDAENVPAEVQQPQSVDASLTQENSTPPQSEQVEIQPTTQENSAVETEVNDDEDFGDELIFDDLQKSRTQSPSVETVEPENPIDIIQTIPSAENEPERITPSTQTTISPQVKNTPTTSSNSKSEKQKKLKLQKLRFVKLTMDKNYIYYLDRDTVSWKRMPYSTTEMMADVWVRMIERNDNELLPDSEIDDVILAAEEGKQFRPEDLEVLRHQKYHLEHYYIRPKAQQIQYLSELSDIEGNPQNTVNERNYSYANWESLVPNSIEYRIYHGVIKVIGKGRSSADAPVTFADMVEEYARISIR